MGHRANFIIVEDDEYSLYYSHWCANTLPRDMFWGPDHAMNFIRAQREVDESGWLDDVWCEGAALVDCEKQLLLLFGGEDIPYDIPLRREYLKLLQKVWSPWKVRWACQGIAEIADHVRYPRAKVLSLPEQVELCENLDPPDELDWTEVVGSIRFPDGSLRIFPLSLDAESYLQNGPTLVLRCDPHGGLDSLALEDWLDESFPTGGFHIDLDDRTVDFWTAKDAGDLPQQLTSLWAGWTVRWHRDKFESQLKATDGRLSFPKRSKKLLQEQISGILLRDTGDSPVNLIQAMTKKQREEGKDVQVNPLALQDDRVELSLSQRREILDKALARKRK